MSEPIPSPCVLICSIEQASGLCHGCGRSMSEISAWATMPSAERDAIMAALPARMATLPKKARRVTKRQERRRTREAGGVAI